MAEAAVGQTLSALQADVDAVRAAMHTLKQLSQVEQAATSAKLCQAYAEQVLPFPAC